MDNSMPSPSEKTCYMVEGGIPKLGDQFFDMQVFTAEIRGDGFVRVVFEHNGHDDLIPEAEFNCPMIQQRLEKL